MTNHPIPDDRELRTNAFESDARTRVFADPYLYVEGWGTRRGLLPCSICGAVTVLGDPDTTDAHVRYHLDRGDLDD